MRRISLVVALAVLVPAVALADPPKPTADWQGTVGAGLILMTGNTQTTTFTGTALAIRESMGWIWTAKAGGAYGQNRAAVAPTPEVSAWNAAGQLRLDRKLGEIWTVYVLGGAETDHVAAVELRGYGELGVSAQWVDVKEKDFQWIGLRTDLGFRYATEKRWQYYGATTGALPGADFYAPRLGLSFRYAFSKDVWFTEEAEFMPGVFVTPNRFQTKSMSKLAARVASNVTTGIGYLVVDDSRPAAGKKRTDTTLTATIDLAY